jgi:hypothetical protein
VERPRPESARARSPLVAPAALAAWALTVGALGVGALAVGISGCGASAPPPAATRPGARPLANVFALGATLSAAEAAEEIAYYRERSAALAVPSNIEIARTDFARLRRGRLYLTEGLRDRETANLERRLSTALSAGDGPQVLDVTGQILARNQADIHAHMLRSITLRRAGQTSEADAQHQIAIGLLESIVRGGDGLGFGSAFTVFDFKEESELAQFEGCLPRSQGLAARGDRAFDVLRAQKLADDSPCDFYFDVTEMMAVVARHFPGQPQ